ncbi:MAG: hypothetical protein NC039_03915 [Muribaculaceae bacterium]|nr:hypothetical protein [Muribaculaceae bacterium]
MRVLLPIVSVLLLMCGCGDGTPRGARTDRPQTGDESGRPGIDGSDNLDKELDDEVWRITGNSVSLRYDSGGVLFTSTGVLVRIVDLDGADVVDATIPAVGRDSLSPGASITMNGGRLNLRHVKMMKESGVSVWYEILAADSSRHVLVVPKAGD